MPLQILLLFVQSFRDFVTQRVKKIHSQGKGNLRKQTSRILDCLVKGR